MADHSERTGGTLLLATEQVAFLNSILAPSTEYSFPPRDHGDRT